MSEVNFSDIPKNFFEGFKDRMGNPICFAFIISWAIINWRFIAFLCLSKLAMSQRIDVIDELYIDIWKNLWLPLMCSTAYLIIMPWVLAGYKWFSGFATTLSQKFVNTHREKQLENAIPVAAKECTLALKRSGKQAIEDLSKERNDLLNDNDELTKSLQAITDKQKELIEENENLTKDYKTLIKDNESLIEDNKKLMSENTTYTGDYKKLSNETKGLMIDNKTLIADNKTLIGNHETLTNDYQALIKNNKNITKSNKALDDRNKELRTGYAELLKEKQQLEEDLAVERGKLEIITSEPKREVIADPTATLSHLLKSNTPTLSREGFMSGAEKAIPDVLKNQKLFGAVSHVDHMTSNDFDQQELLNSLQGLSNPKGLMDPIWNYKKK